MAFTASPASRVAGQTPDAGAPPAAPVVALGKDVFVVRTTAGNYVAYVGPREALVTGPAAPGATPAVLRALRAIRRVPVRWTVLHASDSVVADADGGWRAAGATVVMHESLGYRLAYARPDARAPGAAPPVVPNVGFSDVVQLYVDSESVHVVHQPSGFSNADAITHFESGSVLYLGRIYAGEQYPEFDVANGGSINGMIETVDKFVRFSDKTRIVPARGPVATTRELRQYRAMLAAVRDTVLALRTAGASEDEVVRARVTTPFDGEWGRGTVTPERFVRSVYRSLPKPAANAAPQPKSDARATP